MSHSPFQGGANETFQHVVASSYDTPALWAIFHCPTPGLHDN